MSTQLDYRTIALCSVLALSGCSTGMQPRPDRAPPPVAEPAAAAEPAAPAPSVSADTPLVAWWFGYYRALAAQPAAVLGKECRAAEAAYAADRSIDNRLRLITLLSLRDNPARNPDQAVRLLDGVIGDEFQPPMLRNAAAVMRSGLLAELDDAKRIQSLGTQIKEMQSANKEIQNQLNALKEIERSLYERRKAEVNNKR